MKTKDELKAEFETLKTKYNTVFTIEVPMNDEGTETATLFLKKADRTAHAAIGKLATGNDPLKAVEFALKTLCIGGDKVETVLSDDEALMACDMAIVELLSKRTATLKKN